MQTELFYLKVAGVDGLDYVFKRLPDERFIVDPDMGFTHDIAFKTNDDAQELMTRAFTLDEANAARALLFDAYFPYVGKVVSPVVDLLQIDARYALRTFADERRLLRIRAIDCWVRREGLRGLVLACSSSREDGIRGEAEWLFRRGEAELPQDCYEVQAIRIKQNALVVARYGHMFEMSPGPRARAERFRFIEWNIRGDSDMQKLVTGACRLLRASEAEVIAMSLTANEDFRDVRIERGTLRQLDASEGLDFQEQLFSQAGPAQERAVGFPHFLSVFPSYDVYVEDDDRLQTWLA